MPAQTQTFTEKQISFRLERDEMKVIIPALTERWGESRSHVFRRSLQAAWTVESLRHQGCEIPQAQISSGDSAGGGKSRPVSFSPSTADVAIISDLMRWWDCDLAAVIGRAVRLAYHGAGAIK
jgi:hypothetical protein